MPDAMPNRCSGSIITVYQILFDSVVERDSVLMRRMVFGAGTFRKAKRAASPVGDTARIRKKVATLKSGERQVSFRQTKASSPWLIPRLGGVRGRAELVSSCSPDRA